MKKESAYQQQNKKDNKNMRKVSRTKQSLCLQKSVFMFEYVKCRSLRTTWA